MLTRTESELLCRHFLYLHICLERRLLEIDERTSRPCIIKVNSLLLCCLKMTILKQNPSQLLAILESHETLPSTISLTSSAHHLRRAHAEFHSSFTLNTLRMTFTLDIPSDASPASQIRVGTPASTSPERNTELHHTAVPILGGVNGKFASVCWQASLQSCHFRVCWGR